VTQVEPFGWLRMDRPVEPGMSGSPIVLDDGSAIGVIAGGSNRGGSGGGTYLRGDLPARMLHRR
jgi:hypothetical protein